jgi:hypothetical protein
MKGYAGIVYATKPRWKNPITTMRAAVISFKTKRPFVEEYETLLFVRRFLKDHEFSRSERADVYRIFHAGVLFPVRVFKQDGNESLFLATKREGDTLYYKVARTHKTEQFPNRIDQKERSVKNGFFAIGDDHPDYLKTIATGAGLRFLEGDSVGVFHEIFARPEFG